MKKFILAILVTGIVTTMYAQTDKGDVMVGGRLDLNTGDNSTYIGFTPGVGFFVAKNIAIGGNLGITHQKIGDSKTTNFGIGPFARILFTNSNVKPLLQGSFSYLSSKYKEPGFSSSNTGTNIFLGGGVAVFINENVSIEGLMGYSHSKYKDFDGDGGFNLGIGFQVYLTKRQVDKVRGR
ncbi:MAG: outer membrane beta-barrel protein [Chitinophagaceae bacterium]|nr:outer membrane beta-barrel protein [Chitinophagaceae bacterium]